MKHLGDITKLKGNEIPKVDIITGGSPCQDLSVAGKREGLAGERSGLFMEQIRIIKEMREDDRANGRTDEHIRPRFMVWENVQGALSSNKGEDFRCVLEETAKIADNNATIPRLKTDKQGRQKWSKAGAIMGGGWSIAWRVHDAQFWGVPQRRKRISLVADFNGGCAAEILFERESLYGNIETSREEGKGTTTDAERSVGETSEPILLESNQNHATIQTDGISTSLPASMGMGGGYVPMVMNNIQTIGHDIRSSKFTDDEITDPLTATDYKDPIKISYNSVVRRLTPLECERLQGYPDGWTNIGEWYDSKGKKHKDADSPRYKALGNSIALPFWQWMAEKMVKHLNNPTMGSLFDGIGGFPLVYSRVGCQPIWASEIEEFPMAVTKIRFPDNEVPQ